MADSDRITLAHEGRLELARRVVVGIVDVAAVGARVLLSLEPPATGGWTVRDTALDVRGLQQQQPASTSGDGGGGGGGGGDAVRPVLAAPAEGGSSSSPSPSSAPAVAAGALLLRSFYAPTGGGGPPSPQVSLLVLDAVIPEGAQAEVAAALVELVEGAGADGADGGAAPQLTVVAAMLLQQAAQPAALYQHLINGAAPLDAALPPLQPPSAASAAGSGSACPLRVRDGQLAALLHVLEVSGTPAVCLLAPGHKPPASTTLDLPDSVPACDVIGAAVASAFGLRYDAERCRAVRALNKWFVPEKMAGSDVMYL